MIKGSHNASLPRYAPRDALRASRRAAEPAGQGIAFYTPEQPPGGQQPASAARETPGAARVEPEPGVWVGEYRLGIDPATRGLVVVHEPTGATTCLLLPGHAAGPDQTDQTGTR